MKKERTKDKLRIIPLGGLEQIGMNITAVEYGDSIVVIDCGMAFPEDDMLGIDFVIPDITFLKENADKVKGIVITHGGVGTIIHAVNAKKPVIATPRLAKYGEHHNDHQLQIIKRFAEMGCLIPLYEMEDLKDCLKQAETFVPNSYHSNTEAFVARIRDYLKTIE